MNTLSQPQKRIARRKIHYVDHAIQKWLLMALVVMELALVGAALWLLYHQLSAVVEANLYRIHHSDSQQIFPVLLKNSLYVLAGLIAANVVALVLADRIWGRYVNGIIRAFHGLLNRTEALDFMGDEREAARNHQVIELALSWRETERVRCRKIREASAGLDAALDFSDPAVREATRSALERLRRSLP